MSFEKFGVECRLLAPRHRAFGSAMAVLLATLLAGCAVNHERVTPVASRSHEPRHIFVFFEGTRNDKKSNTNIVRTYELIKNEAEGFRKKELGPAANVAAIWIEGVGNGRNPLTGAMLGKGMSNRIRKGYAFISEHYRPGDRIYIFGFSRGAHQARALAGLISYSGVMVPGDTSSEQLAKSAKVVQKFVKEYSDEDFKTQWERWNRGDDPILAAKILESSGVKTQEAEIGFLGVWDTVPGSSLKEFGVCKEVKNDSPGDRYKSESYPTIRVIAHAVSLDEVRNKFAPLLICQGSLSMFAGRAQKDFPAVHERWFPGAHSDVGGGFDDATGLPDISLSWMLALLETVSGMTLPKDKLNADPFGRAHWMINGWWDEWLYDCQDRVPPEGADVDQTVKERKGFKGPLRLRPSGAKEDLLAPYPTRCPKNGKETLTASDFPTAPASESSGEAARE